MPITPSSLFLKTSAESYSISRSLRFNSADSAYLSRTPGSAGNRKTYTWSGWVKRASLGSVQWLFGVGPVSTDYMYLRFTASDTLEWGRVVSSAINGNKITTQVFRDTSAWYHIVCAIDAATTSAKLYVNGVEITAFGTSSNPANVSGPENNTVIHSFGRYADTNIQHFDGYMAEVHFVDGTALTPSSFGQTDSITGQWVPKQVTGVTYGTNGFYLSFANNASTTTIGYDDAGGAAGSGAGSNDWTANNFSVTAGVGNDSLTDTPTNNYCTFTPLTVGANTTISEGGLKTANSASHSHTRGTFGMISGKWYWEVTTLATVSNVGIVNGNSALSSYVGSDANGWGYIGSGEKITGGSPSTYGASFTTNDIIGVAFDADIGTLEFFKNGASQGSAYTGLTSGPYFPASGNANSTQVANFGQRAFSHTPPTGFQALCTSNLTHPGSSTPKTGSFTGNASADGPFVWLGYQPNKSGTCTINGNAITWGTHADALANGLKVRTSSSSYNTAGSNTYSIAITEAASFARNAKAQVNQ